MHDIHQPDEQGFIPFIHNYCDRRCEKCRFVRQCRVGILEVDDLSEENTEVAGERVDDYAERLWKVMGLPGDEDAAEEESWDLDMDDDDEPDPDWEKEHAATKKALEEHPLTHLTEAYVDLVADWFEPREERLRAKGVVAHATAELRLPSASRTPEMLLLSEALEEVLWFQVMLHAKAQRALMGKVEGARFERMYGLDPIQSDRNGTAKLILHILDRCEGAWKMIAEHWPEEAGSTEPMLECLKRCRDLLSQEFPQAHRFVRPGFDAP